LYLHKVITQILKENDLLPKKSEEPQPQKVEQFQPMIKQVMRL
jgi:hypothetical protein